MIGQAICETLSETPGICNSYEPKAVIQEEQTKSVFISVLAYFYTIVVGLLVLALICICVARRAARREVNEEVKKSVANYFNMREIEAIN